MGRIRVFIDSSVFIAWLNQTQEYSDIERIRKLAGKEIEVIVSADILWEIANGSDGSRDEQKIIKEWKINNIVMIDPDKIIGDSNGSYAAKLAKNRKEWVLLSKSIYDEKDSKHVASADSGCAGYYLTLDGKHINKMRNHGRKYFTSMKFVNPCGLIKMIFK